MSSVAAVLLSAFLFGVMHLDVVQGVGAGLLGVFLGFLALRVGIWAAIAAHATNNFFMALMARYGEGGEEAWTHGHPLWFVVFSFFVTVAMVWIILRRTSTRHKTSENAS